MNKYLAKAKSIAIAILLGVIIIPLGVNLYSLMVMTFNDADAMPIFFTPYYLTRSYSNTDEVDAVIRYMDYRGFVLDSTVDGIMHFSHTDGRKESVSIDKLINLFTEDEPLPETTEE